MGKATNERTRVNMTAISDEYLVRSILCVELGHPPGAGHGDG